MSGYSDMLAQGLKFAAEEAAARQKGRKTRKNATDELAASLLSGLQDNIYQRQQPVAPPETPSETPPFSTQEPQSGACGSVTSGVTCGVTSGVWKKSPFQDETAQSRSKKIEKSTPDEEIISAKSTENETVNSVKSPLLQEYIGTSLAVETDTSSVTSDACDSVTSGVTSGACDSACSGVTSGVTSGVWNDDQNKANFDTFSSDAFEKILVKKTEKNAHSDIEHAATEPAMRTDPATWTDFEKRVFAAFSEQNPAGDCLFSYPVLSTKLGISPATIRRIAERFERAGLISRKRVIAGRTRGVEVRILRHGNAVSNACSSVTCGATSGACDSVCDEVQNRTYMVNQEIILNTKRRKKKDLSISTTVWGTKKGELQAMWPNVCTAGFTTEHLRQLERTFEIQHFESASVALSLRYLDWQLEQGNGELLNAKGEPVDDPVAYWMASMRRHGYYGKPKGYLDPLVAAKRLLLEQEREQAKTEQALLDVRQKRETAAKEQKREALLAEILTRGENHPRYAAFFAALPEVLQTRVLRYGLQALREPVGRAGLTRTFETLEATARKVKKPDVPRLPKRIAERTIATSGSLLDPPTEQE